MRRIVLASGSLRRRQLLTACQVPFVVKKSSVVEETTITTTCAALVKHNARIKACDVASREKDSIVIGADTVVYLGGTEVIGKPRDLRDARRILKKLFAKPHWVYTGVAVIDSRTQRMVVDYEKTKIYMAPLTDSEIERYHQKTHPFDKAGGFNIEGAGGTFIRRIEGCYSNVIGLPMAKLTVLLKKFGVTVLTVLCLFFTGGCATEYNLATKKQETLMYGTDKEMAIGESIAQSFEKEYEMVSDRELQQRVEAILARIVAVCDRTDLVYFVKVADDEMVNAVSLPGGYIYLFKGLTDKIKTDDQLAGVIAHEMGHITARHAMKRMQAAYSALFLQILAVQTAPNVAGGVSFALSSLFLSYSQEDEFEADRLSVKYMKAAGFEPQGVVQLLQMLKAEEEKAPIRQFSYWRTHPFLAQRLAAVNQAITGKLEFRDYLNLTSDQ